MLNPAMQRADGPDPASSHEEPAAPSQHPPTAGYSLQEAAAILGVSLNTLRRRIDAGQVQAEKVDRPQGHIWRVYLDSVQPAPDPAEQRAEQQAGSTLHQDAASTLPQPPTAIAQAEAMATYTRSLLEPLVALVEQQEVTIREQAETVGELRAENRALLAHTAPQSVEPTQESPTPLSRLLALWRWLVLVLVVAVTTMVVLLVWPR